MAESSKRAGKIGLFLTTEETKMDGATPRWSDFEAMATRAEALGFDSIWIPDHFIYERDGGRSGAWEAFSILAGLAAVTERVELGPLVACLPFHNPALLAKMAETIDEISGGRFVLGLGAGWNEPEFRAFGYPFDRLYSRFEEGIQIVDGLLRQGQVDFDGRFYSADDCELRPRGPRPSGPPILIGTMGEKMLGLTARYADRWNLERWQIGDDGLEGAMRRVDAACEKAGRDPKSLERSLFAAVELGPGNPAIASRQPAQGSHEQIAEWIQGQFDGGMDHLQIWLEPMTVESIEEFAEVVKLLDRT
jgi:probable F420-dependent oxidoreductase